MQSASVLKRKKRSLFRGNELRLILNDRLNAPNTENTHNAIKDDLQAFLHQLYNGSEVAAERRKDVKQRFTLDIRAEGDWSVAKLIENLS